MRLKRVSYGSNATNAEHNAGRMAPRQKLLDIRREMVGLGTSDRGDGAQPRQRLCQRPDQ